MANLIVKHVPAEAPTFSVLLEDGTGSEPVQVPSPVGFPVEGRPNSDLLRELRWYLEDFLDYPFPPETDHADRILAALKSWGTQAFKALFGTLDGGRLFSTAT